jgi:hypothetical protein
MTRRSTSRERSHSAGREPKKAQDLTSISYQQFKATLFEVAKSIYPIINPYQACIELVKDKIIPLQNRLSD